jgi:hypothetical protein
MTKSVQPNQFKMEKFVLTLWTPGDSQEDKTLEVRGFVNWDPSFRSDGCPYVDPLTLVFTLREDLPGGTEFKVTELDSPPLFIRSALARSCEALLFARKTAGTV